MKITFESNKIGNSYNVEGILCLATLIASSVLPAHARIDDAKFYYEEGTNSDCGNCLHQAKCLACIINE